MSKENGYPKEVAEKYFNIEARKTVTKYVIASYITSFAVLAPRSGSLAFIDSLHAHMYAALASTGWFLFLNALEADTERYLPAIEDGIINGSIIKENLKLDPLAKIIFDRRKKKLLHK